MYVQLEVLIFLSCINVIWLKLQQKDVSYALLVVASEQTLFKKVIDIFMFDIFS